MFVDTLRGLLCIPGGWKGLSIPGVEGQALQPELGLLRSSHNLKDRSAERCCPPVDTEDSQVIHDSI